jgi:hypothetical protein
VSERTNRIGRTSIRFRHAHCIDEWALLTALTIDRLFSQPMKRQKIRLQRMIYSRTVGKAVDLVGPFVNEGRLQVDWLGKQKSTEDFMQIINS